MISAMEELEPCLSLGLAVAAGLLIGLERERSAPKDPKVESFLGGARTHPLLALVVLLASSILFARVLVLVAAVNPRLLAPLALPMTAMLIAGLVGSAVLYRRAKLSDGDDSEVSFSNPFELSKALGFGQLYAPTEVKIVPPSWARFLPGQRFDLRVEGKGTGPFSAALEVNGKTVAFTSGEQGTTSTDGITAPGYGGFNVRGYALGKPGRYELAATFTDATGTTTATSTIEIVGVRGDRSGGVKKVILFVPVTRRSGSGSSASSGTRTCSSRSPARCSAIDREAAITPRPRAAACGARRGACSPPTSPPRWPPIKDRDASLPDG